MYLRPTIHHLSRACSQGLAGAGYLATNAMYTVDAGHMSLKVGRKLRAMMRNDVNKQMSDFLQLA